MPERDFYNVNDFTAYPLVEADSRAFLSSGELPRRGLVDAGFMLGLDSGFVPGIHAVTLYSFTHNPADVVFDFRADAPGLASYHWLFTFPIATPYGCTAYANAKHLISAVDDIHRGTAYLTLGDITELLTISLGVKLLATPPRVEPALLQSLVNTFARGFNLANNARACPPSCCTSSSSSSSSGAPDDAFAATLNLVGHVKFSEGNNIRISVRESDNSIEFGPARGAGLGEPCEDVVIDAHGFQRGNECENCDELVRSINGRVSSTGRLRLTGGPGVVVEPDPILHKVCITFEEDFICGSSSSGP